MSLHPALDFKTLKQFLTAQDNFAFELAQLMRPSAVFIGIKKRETELYLVLTKRTAHLNHHPGQICFPGGRFESADNTLDQTAIREVSEEIGLATSALEIWHTLPAQPTITGFTIIPYVGHFLATDYRICTEEVAEIIEVPLAFFLNAKNRQTNEAEYRGRPVQFFSYDYGKHRIWGATAKIISDFVDKINHLNI